MGTRSARHLSQVPLCQGTWVPCLGVLEASWERGANTWIMRCLVPVRRFPSLSRSIHFGDVSEANGRETFSIGPRDPKRFGRAE